MQDLHANLSQPMHNCKLLIEDVFLQETHPALPSALKCLLVKAIFKFLVNILYGCIRVVYDYLKLDKDGDLISNKSAKNTSPTFLICIFITHNTKTIFAIRYKTKSKIFHK